MAGIIEIGGELPAQCPHCRGNLDLGDFIQMMFRRALERLKSGEKVQINEFGVFTAKETKFRAIEGFDGTKHKARKKRIIRFHASPKAKDFVNGKK